jgi:hypothetical protein
VNRKLVTARRDVERLRMQAAGADETAVAIWEAGNRVADLEQAERESAVSAARNVARVMDVVLLVVALLTMAFSLQNIHDFAADHGVQDPIAWFLAPAVDLALLAALVGDALLSRWQLDAGGWARALRWYAGAATLALNSWEAVAALDPAGIVLHASLPILLFILGEAAMRYRFRFTETVQLARERLDADPAGQADSPAPVVADTPEPSAPAADPGEVYDQEADPGVSTMTSQDDATVPLRPVATATEADDTAGRLDAEAAKAAIERAWTEGLTVREAAVRATRSPSYVGGVYQRLERERGSQPSKAHTLEGAAA